jgi:AcrR family transcriptional regulator
MKPRREEYTDATRAALLRAGRKRFGKLGYSGASLEEIAGDARVTTGAIYHHFGSKKGLFQAVAEQVEAELMVVATQTTSRDRWEALHESFDRLVAACAASDVQQIVFRDAAQVIGLEAWRAIEVKYGYGVLNRTLARLIEDGRIRPYPLELLAPVVLALLSEASRAVAMAKDKAAAQAEARDLVGRLLDGLRV